MQISILRILIGLFALLGATAAHAQCINTYTKPSLSGQILQQFPIQFNNAITPQAAQAYLNNALASWQQGVVVNPQVGTSYTVVTDASNLSDNGKMITFNSALSVAVSLANASASGSCPFSFYVSNLGAGAVTITPVSGTIGGSSSLQLTTNQGVLVVSDGTNWQIFKGIGASSSGAGGSNTQLQYNNGGVLGGISGATTNGTAVTFASSDAVFAGSSSGTTTLNASATASGTLTLPAATDTLTANAASQTLTNKTLSGGTISGSISGSPTITGTWNFTGPFEILGTVQTFPGSGNLVGLGDTQTLTNKSINGAEINSGTVLATYLPTATSAALGVIEGDGSTLTITAGVIKCTTATTSQLGCVKPDGTTITINGSGVITAVGSSASAITVASTAINGATDGQVLIRTSGDLGAVSTTGTGNVVLAAGPTLSGTIGGNLTFSGNIVLDGTLTAGSLATPGTIAGTLCASAAGAIFYNAGNNCFGGGFTSADVIAGTNLVQSGTCNSASTITCTISLASTVASPTFSGTVTMPDSSTHTSSGLSGLVGLALGAADA